MIWKLLSLLVGCYFFGIGTWLICRKDTDWLVVLGTLLGIMLILISLINIFF